MIMSENGYLPIEDYGLIGNLRTVALVGRSGAIDWCCFPYMDRESVFAALLDMAKGGRFRVSVRRHGREVYGLQEYIPKTNILKTVFEAGGPLLTLTDFMPLNGDLDCLCESEAPPEIRRILESHQENLEVEVEWSPRFGYARKRVQIQEIPGGFAATGGEANLSLAGLRGARISEDEHGPVLHARFSLGAGERLVLVTRWDSLDTEADLDRTLTLMAETARSWEKWVDEEKATRARSWAGEWHPHVRRSSLVFKLLTIADAGSIAAAPTTSLPEEIGGVRNWDYRYAWIRDAAMTTQALIALGHETDAAAVFHWMEEVSASHTQGLDLKIMYGLHGEEDLEELELEHLEGYRGSAPVRIGNGAAGQFQLEIYGELLNTAYEMARRGHSLPPAIREFLSRAADHVCEVWEEPDYGIWEVRGGKAHFTYSKVMAWVALDRAVHLAREYDYPGDPEKWTAHASEIRSQVLDRGFNRELGSFVMSYGSDLLDAANLRIPLLEFLPVDDPRVAGTINLTMEHLMENDMVYRYHAEDGLPGKEGTFGLCTFWLIDVLSLAGRLEEANRLFRNMLDHSNHLGLFAEQIDARTGAFLGNFPQAFTHIGLINSALYLACAQGKVEPEHAPIGTRAHMEMMGRKYPAKEKVLPA
jgi:GH15 family glucan-1,4-alpha-glucosidase